MPKRPPIHGYTPRKPWQGAKPSRLRGRARMKRNARIKLRDGYTCQGCGRVTRHLEIDHRVPLSQGGTEDDDNLQSLCCGPGSCHEAKSRADRKRGRGGSETLAREAGHRAPSRFFASAKS